MSATLEGVVAQQGVAVERRGDLAAVAVGVVFVGRDRGLGEERAGGKSESPGPGQGYGAADRVDGGATHGPLP